MTNEEKQLLLIDLCARLPYGVIVDNPDPAGGAWDEVINIDIPTKTVTLLYDGRVFSVEEIRPYLRPLSSMTNEERKEYNNECNKVLLLRYSAKNHYPVTDWLLAHHFDFRGLIENGLALEAPEGMYE